jgi:hypothetical protein
LERFFQKLTIIFFNFSEPFHNIGAAEIRDVYMKAKPEVAPTPRSQVIAYERLKKGIKPLSASLQPSKAFPNIPVSLPMDKLTQKMLGTMMQPPMEQRSKYLKISAVYILVVTKDNQPKP